jgi:hypothetical protein
MPNENALFFCHQQVFDTSFLVHLQKENGTVHGVLYEVLPTYHRDVNTFAEEEEELLFFEGYSFKIDTAKWNSIKKMANALLLQERDSGQNYKSCYDCPLYFVLHDSTTAINFGVKPQLFKDFDKYMKDSLLKKYIERRRLVKGGRF